MMHASHLVRRGEMYYRRRRLPSALAKCRKPGHISLSLKTGDQRTARTISRLLNSVFEDVLSISVAKNRVSLTAKQIKSIMTRVRDRHLKYLHRRYVHDLAYGTATAPDFHAECCVDSLRFKAMAMGFGQDPHRTDTDKIARDIGLDPRLIVEFFDGWMEFTEVAEPSHPKLASLVRTELNNTPLENHPADLTHAIKQARIAYFQAMSAACASTSLFDKGSEDELDDRLDGTLDITWAQRPPETDQVAISLPASGSSAADTNLFTPSTEPQAEGAPDPTIQEMVERLCEYREADGLWQKSSLRQNGSTYRLLCRFLDERLAIRHPHQIQQHHLAAFDGFLRELPAILGKSARRKDFSVAQIEAFPALPRNEKRLTAQTRNRHAWAVDQLIKFLNAQGLIRTPLKALRAKLPKTRARDGRDLLNTTAIDDLLNRPLYTGCASSTELATPGTNISTAVFISSR